MEKKNVFSAWTVIHLLYSPHEKRSFCVRLFHVFQLNDRREIVCLSFFDSQSFGAKT